MAKKEYKAIGLMSGTSLDGLDMVYVVFREHDGKWQYEIEKADTKSYDPEWKESLKMSFYQSGEALTALDAEYGRYQDRKLRSSSANKGSRRSISLPRTATRSFIVPIWDTTSR